MSSNQRPAVATIDHSLLGAIFGLTENAQKEGGLVKVARDRETAELDRVERARQRREAKKRIQERRDLIAHLVRLVRDDATPSALHLTGSSGKSNEEIDAEQFKRYKDNAGDLPEPTIEDMLNGLDEEELGKICQVLPRNRSLEHLFIMRNCFKGSSMKPLCNALIAVHTNLLTLDVSRNPLGSVGVTHLANGIEDNRRLQTLIIVGVTATDDGATVDGVVALAAALERNNTLTKLDISSNNITDFTGKMDGMARLAAALEINTGLKDLNISDNCVGEIGAELLDHCVVKNTTLTSLELGMNRLGPVGGQHIANLMSRRSFAKIQYIGLASNELCGRYGNQTMEPIYKISKSLINHSTLTTLNLKRNGITSNGGRSLAESLRRNTALTSLIIGGNSDEVSKDFISKKLIQTRTLANSLLSSIVKDPSTVDNIDRKKQTCLHIAADAGSVDVANRLLSPELNAQSDLRNFRSLTPLHCAIESRDAPMITVLLSQADCDLSLSDSVGDTCLHKAVRSGDGALASLLLLKGADMEQRNNAGFRPLDLTKSQLLRELLLKTVSRRPVWFICGREDDELHFGLRIRRTLMARGGVECWFSGGGVSSVAMDIRNSDDPLYEDPVDDDVISINAFQNDVPLAMKRMSRTKMNKLFAGYEGDPGDLGPEMMKRCSSCIFLAGHYAMRSPMCLSQLHSAVDNNIPIIVANCFAGMMPDFMESALSNATFINFVPSFMPQTIERGQASFVNSFEKMVNILRINERKYIDGLPRKMTSMIGQDADAFALEQVDGKFFVLLSHGGVHTEFAMTMKHELEQSRLWCFCSHGDEHMDLHKKKRFQKAMETCMVYCPIISEKSLKSTELLKQIQMADKMGKPTFPIMLSSIHIPKDIRTPVTVLRRQAFVFHCHNGDESGAINFRINFDHLSRVVRARVAEASVLIAAKPNESILLERANNLKMMERNKKRAKIIEKVKKGGGRGSGEGGMTGVRKDETVETKSIEEKEDSMNNIAFVAGSPVKAAKQNGRNFSPNKKSLSRYEQLHQRVLDQQAALVEAQESLERYKLEHEQMSTKLQMSKNITGELLMCVEYYRSKSNKYHEMLYPTPIAPGKKRTPNQERLNQLRRELAKVSNMPKRNRTVVSDVLHQGVPQTHNRYDFEIALMREIDKVAEEEGAIALQRVARGYFTRERLYREKLLRSAIFVQSRFRGYQIRKKLIWEDGL